VRHALILLLIAGLGACNDSKPAPMPTPAPDATDAADERLPAAVEQTRQRIVRAARSFDYAALETLVDPKNFQYSAAESGDPVGYWSRLESENDIPVLADIIPAVFATRGARSDGQYVWPAASVKNPGEWSERDIRELLTLTTEENMKSYREFGSYVGWRASIRADGTWLAFIVGA